MNRYYFNLIFCVLLFISAGINAQSKPENLKWENVVYSQPDEWYGSAEAVRVAQNVLLYQRNVGGWPKNKEIHKVLTETEKKELHQLQSTGIGATIDNGATIMELTFLSKIYAKTKDSQYKAAFLKGINYLFDAQYDNGGWPQFYPLEKGDYSLHITFNDNAMVNVMNVMKAIAEKSARFSVEFNDATVLKARKAFEKGVQVILKTQYRQNGVLTAWCAQHDEITLLPVRARSYELPSLSGGESPGIVILLMSIDNPSAEIINSIQSAVSWFDKVKIEGIRVEGFTNKDGLKDRKVVADKAAPPLWARFYELDDNRPFFCDRDGIKKYSLAEIGHERRNGYSWYGTGPQKVLDQYKKWQPKWAPAKNVIVKKP